ncbi:MAG: polysaccharide deacetylase family protein [Bacilli bacterium]|nr:polysaccharide deacetylase family protein [Bacilli bacterium]
MKKRRLKKGPILIILLIIILIVGSLIFLMNEKKKEEIKEKKIKEKELVEKIKSHYSEFAKSKENVKIYDENEKEIGEISNIELKLKKEKINKDTKYFYIENLKAYISYKDVEKIDKITKYETNRIPFNKEVTTKENTKLNIDEKTYYKFNKEITFSPIQIDDKYYFIYDDKLVYINKEDIKEEKDIQKYNSTSAIAVINYHYVVNEEETKECRQSICERDYQYDEQMKYIKENNFYTATMEDLDLWIDGKINLPEKTVVITIDDGWYLPRNIEILEKYNLHATLFLIGHLASPDAYKSDSLEIHSHTWDMHNLGECPIGRGGAILCKDKAKIIEDLKKSSESLNNSKYFAYPFYEYNDHAIEALKEAGFKMAFAGGGRKVTRGVDKYTVPRFGISNTDTLEKIKNIIN